MFTILNFSNKIHIVSETNNSGGDCMMFFYVLVKIILNTPI